ncbi:geranylgeranylglycerol-phosphate geranylgeranyltransferase [Luteibaculum oceani]|uniref:Prenyltransferase n=1 Tax=Luteibaculum oceani TaxID=1294296 RepID=A0A5C6UUK1_9FLAO|nr:geranylgeranylglycerol-phosphate geranylgeranyltransferase [Luteibaculum oceani]TXC77052.1 hypothetical protein FRX97_09305 [Luteibaculum oceani]
MKNTLAFIKLARPLNLVIIAATLYAMRYWVLLPMLEPKNFELPSSLGLFTLLVISVVMIAAGGNIINDYFDTKTDAVNKPGRMIVGVHLDRRVALYSHGILTFLGIGLGAYYGYQTGTLRFIVLHVFVAISLWYYSTYFKRETPLGNFVIALLTGLVPLTIGFFDLFPIVKSVSKETATELADQGLSLMVYFKILIYWILGFSLFAFWGNLIRELLKDLADLKGDIKAGRRTLPIVLGEKGGLWISVGYVLVWCLGLLIVEWQFLDSTLSLCYILGLLIFPMLAILAMMFRFPNEKTYKRAATGVKWILFFGLCFSYFVKTIVFE